jgi:NAD(P)-binding Rossmann-like domain
MQDFRTAVREAVRDEAALRGALAEADIAPMLMVLVQLTGDLDFLEEVAPHIHGPWSFLQSVPEPLKQEVRDRLVAALQDYAANGRPAPPRPPADVLQRMMGAGVGQTVPEEYIPLLLEEMRFGEEDTRAVRWHRDPAKLPLQGFKVVVIGAGFGGLCAAIRLKQLGIPFEVLEKNADVGGLRLAAPPRRPPRPEKLFVKLGAVGARAGVAASTGIWAAGPGAIITELFGAEEAISGPSMPEPRHGAVDQPWIGREQGPGVEPVLRKLDVPYLSKTVCPPPGPGWPVLQCAW